jgi:hypothetical protein
MVGEQCILPERSDAPCVGQQNCLECPWPGRIEKARIPPIVTTPTPTLSDIVVSNEPVKPHT